MRKRLLRLISEANRILLLVVNTVTNKVSRILGKDENNRFLDLSLFQGTVEKQRMTTIVSLNLASKVTANHFFLGYGRICKSSTEQNGGR